MCVTVPNAATAAPCGTDNKENSLGQVELLLQTGQTKLCCGRGRDRARLASPVDCSADVGVWIGGRARGVVEVHIAMASKQQPIPMGNQPAPGGGRPATNQRSPRSAEAYMKVRKANGVADVSGAACTCNTAVACSTTVSIAEVGCVGHSVAICNHEYRRFIWTFEVLALTTVTRRCPRKSCVR